MNATIEMDFFRKVCGTCGVVFYIPQILENEYNRVGQAWTCPNGHSRSYAESEADKYKRLYQEEREAKKEQARLAADAVENAERLRGQLENCDKKLRAKPKKRAKK